MRPRRTSRPQPAAAGWLGATHGVQLLGTADGALRVQLLHEVQRSAGNGAASWVVQRCPGGCDCAEQPDDRPRKTLPVQRGLLDDAAAIGGELLGSLRSRAAAMVAAVRDRAAAAWAGLSGMASSLGEGLESRVGSLVDGLTGRWDALQAAARSAWDTLASRAGSLAEALQSRLGQLVAGLRAGWDALKGAGRALLDGLMGRASALLELLKGRAGSLLATTGQAGACIAPGTLQQARSELGGAGGDALGLLESEASGVLSGLLGQWSGLDSESRSESGALHGLAEAVTGQLGSDASSAKASVEASGSDLDRESAAATGRLGSESGAGLDAARGQAATAADQVRGEATGGTSGLRGMLGALGDLVARAAESVIGSAAQQTGAAQSDLDGKSRSLLAGLQGLVRSLAARLEAAVQRIKAGLERLAGELAERAAAAARLLEQGWARARARAAEVLGRLRAGWNALRAKASSVWRSMRERLLVLRGRAFSALTLAESGSCRPEESLAQAQDLAGAQVEGPAGAALGDPVLFKGGPGALGTPGSPAALGARLGPGRPLEPRVRARMETAIGADFSRVRLHTDGEGARTAGELNARAFTFADHVSFAAGEYQPDTLVGDALIAHELAHLVQQRSASKAAFEHEDGSDTAIELDADRSAVLAVARLWLGARAGVEARLEGALPQLRSGLRLRRCSGCNCNTSPTFKCCTENLADAGPLVPVEADRSCEPLGQDLWDVRSGQKLANPLERPSVVGLTSWSYQSALDWAGSPGATFDAACWEQCKPVLSSPPTFLLSPFEYTKDGRYPAYAKSGDRLTIRAPKGGPCAGKLLPASYVFSEALGKKVRDAEAEHCQDLKVAWKLTFGRYLAAANELKDGFCAPERKDDVTAQNTLCADLLKQRLGARSGLDQAKLAKAAECLIGKTKEGRDDSGNHNVSFEPKKKVPTADCKEIDLVLADDASQLPNLGKPSPEELMTGCT